MAARAAVSTPGLAFGNCPGCRALGLRVSKYHTAKIEDRGLRDRCLSALAVGLGPLQRRFAEVEEVVPGIRLR